MALGLHTNKHSAYAPKFSQLNERAQHLPTASRPDLPLDELSIVIPVFRDAQALKLLLRQLRTALDEGADVIVVGAHGDDSAAQCAKEEACRYVVTDRGRGTQLADGAEATDRSKLWFLHADSTLPKNAANAVCRALATHAWGRFDVRFGMNSGAFRVIAVMMNWRSRQTCIATGDQGIFVRRDVYNALGGYARIPLMEDVEFSARLRKSCEAGAPACIRDPIIISSRKWQREGVIRTVLRMWWWRFRFWWGTSPETLAQEYYRDTN